MDDVTLIRIQSNDWKYVLALQHHHANAEALERVEALNHTHDLLDDGSLEEVGRLAGKERAVADELAVVLNIQCPKCVDTYTRKKRVMTADELVAGQCVQCKTLIVRGD